uniref:Uncharacterized protein n=1 Tax=Chrysotila carterae TaxID=13221 RepID=A0A7S4B438_CHRCT|mmetsp:Transcript_47022/g.102126  ORF Transcript_47022/g.102126 Transcript_47022/m.102126 type:complete len:230 (-) Transcript_47022:607-1296(-)
MADEAALKRTSTDPCMTSSAEAAEAASILEHASDNALKIILLGDSAVGKSKLVERFLMNDYQPRQLSTYALTLFRHAATINGEEVNVDFWDTAGQERFNSMHPAYYHMAHACIICFDVTRKQTYKNLPAWYKELRDYRGSIPVICVANKIDVDLKVTQKEFAFPKKHNMELFYCSASDGTNVVSAFNAAIEKAVEYSKSPSDDFVDQVMGLIDSTQSMRMNKEKDDGGD